MRPAISEFSYGFALTSELLRAPGMTLTAAPVFPSLIREGRPGGGWDVRIDRPGIPLFLQFKLSDCMRRRSCKEVRDEGFTVPCYRMHLRSRRLSAQHEMLLDLEADGNEVYYSAPEFHRPEELNDAFLTSAVRFNSIWIRPSEIGPLRDDRDHHVSFGLGNPWAFFSEKARRLDVKRDFADLSMRWVKLLKAQGKETLGEEKLMHLADSIANIAGKHTKIREKQKAETRVKLSDLPPLQRVAYYASIFLESQLFVVQTLSNATV